MLALTLGSYLMVPIFFLQFLMATMFSVMNPRRPVFPSLVSTEWLSFQFSVLEVLLLVKG
jgi:hypothetical protein